MESQTNGVTGRSVFSVGLLLACVSWVGWLGGETPTVRADMYVYPAKGQDKAQQQKDDYECHIWAVDQTSFDPTKAAPSSNMPAQPERGGAVRGATRGAALGAIGGAIAGDAGKGAAIGAAVGGGGGALRQRRRNLETQAQQQQSQQAYHHTLDGYNRAKAACLEGRGYTVKQ